MTPDQQLQQLLELQKRFNLLVDSLSVLEKLIHLQSIRIDALEDHLKALHDSLQ